MTEFVLDCSLTMAWIFPDEATDATGRLRDSLVDGRAFAPALWPIKVGNVILAATRRGRLAREEWPAIRAHLETLPVEIDPVSASRTWGAVVDLAEMQRISVYDATYLELAARLRLPLATLDRQLGAAARAVGVDTPALAQ